MFGTLIRFIASLQKSRASRAMIAASAMAGAVGAATLPNLFPFKDPSGVMETNDAMGPIDESGPFFQSLGTNGRSCATCHIPANAFGLSAAQAESIYHARTAAIPFLPRLMAPSAQPQRPVTH